jgi:hypothetical protein
VFEVRVVRRIFGPKKDKVTREWRRLHREELYAACSLPNIIRAIKSRLLRWATHVELRGTGQVHTGFKWENLRDGDHLEDPGVDGRIILKLIFEKWVGRAWSGSIWLRIGNGGGLL